MAGLLHGKPYQRDVPLGSESDIPYIRCKSDDTVVGKVTAALRNFSTPDTSYEKVMITGDTEPGVSLGLFLKKDVVAAVRHDSKMLGVLRPGDILLNVNGQPITNEHPKNKDIFQKAQNEKQVTINLIRFKPRPPPNHVLTTKFVPEKGFVCEWVCLYWIRGMNLGLELRDVDDRCFVVGLAQDGIANMALSIGDRIVDICGDLITSSQMAAKSLLHHLETQGYVNIYTEVPDNDKLKNFIRNRIQNDCAKDAPPDIPPHADAQHFIGKAIEEAKTGKPGKSILRTGEGKAVLISTLKLRTKRLKFNEKTTEHGYFVESKNKLFVAVPPTKSIETEAAKKKLKEKKFIETDCGGNTDFG